MWSSVGSVGVLNSSDAGKVLFTGSRSRNWVLGLLGPNHRQPRRSKEPRIEERMIGFPTVAATLRYPVQEVDLGDSGPGA